jgi:hypothetical protein
MNKSALLELASRSADEAADDYRFAHRWSDLVEKAAETFRAALRALAKE